MLNGKKVALFGGSFNPIQNAHIEVVRKIVGAGHVDEVWILPCCDHSFGKSLALPEDRIKMIELSFSDLDSVKVCREELDFDGKSYAYDTVMRLKGKFDYDFYWICGSDILYEFDRWYRYEELSNEIGFFVVKRSGFPLIDVPYMNILGSVESDPSDLSSTRVREFVLEGRSLDEMVPLKVEKYIRDKSLYK
jgi:nicotinate-nucleotide adenylyltransferase